MHSGWSLAALGFVVALALSVVLIALAPLAGWVDHPDQERKSHARPTARTAGMALWGLLGLAQATGWLSLPLGPLDWAGIHAMALVGALDDRFNLRARYKALVGLAVAAVLAGHSAAALSRETSQVMFFDLEIPSRVALLFPFLFAWYWSIPQAYNLIDGINGLSMGLGLLLLGLLGMHQGPQAAVLGGGLLAVLALNFPRAKHFLGDCGALMLGTLFALLSVKLLVAQDADLPVWLFAYPIADVSLVVAIRRWHHRPFSTADRSHLHHWMMDHVGQRSWLATPILLTLAALPMMRALSFPGAHTLSGLGTLALLALCVKAFLDRVLPVPQEARGVAQVRRDVPLMREAVVRNPSGSHPTL